MRKTATSWLATAAAVGSSCAWADLPANVEIRAFMNESCIVADEPYLLERADAEQVARSLSIGGLVVGKLAHTFLNSLVRATSAQLGAMARPKDVYYVAANDFNLYRAALAESPLYGLNDKLACATVVAAAFEPDDTDCTHRYLPKVLADLDIDPDEFAGHAIRQDDSVENILRRANVCVRDSAHSVFETRFEISDDRTAYRLQSAGLWVGSLLSTKSRKASRGIVYTMDIAEPAANAEMRVLSSAWIDMGEIRAGYSSTDTSFASRSEWLRIPDMSAAAREAYQVDTALHQDVYAEIQALERSVTRDRRQRDSMRQRMAAASESIRDAVQADLDLLELRILRSESLLDARRAEYADLPRPAISYMPVTIRFGVIESRSQKRALATLAAYLEKNSVRISDTAAGKLGIARDADFGGDGDTAGTDALEQARSDYFDALVEYRQASSGNTEDAESIGRELARARETYNAARTAAGIVPLE